MTKAKIIVVGSSNMDMVVQSPHLPAPGETVLGGEFFMNPGGKGANQAVAASRLGAKVSFISKLGNDIFGAKYRNLLDQEEIYTDYVYTDSQNASGIALITVDEKGENAIVVAPGANNALGKEDLDLAQEAFVQADYVLMQLEVPLETVTYAAQMAAKMGKKVVLNPAPATDIPDELFSSVYILTPNETEAKILSGVEVKDQDSARSAAQIIRNKGVNHVIITLGKDGAFVFSDHLEKKIPGRKVHAKDATAAGDVFNGALLVGLSEGMILQDAIEMANEAASVSVTRMGAQASAPYRHEIQGLGDPD